MRIEVGNYIICSDPQCMWLEEKYTGKEEDKVGDEQFEISDERSLTKMYRDMAAEGLQPVLNDYLYV